MRPWFGWALAGFWLGLAACTAPDAPAAGETNDTEASPADRTAAALADPESAAGTIHIVRMVARGDHYAFEPAELTVRSGDVVRFMQTGYQPEAVAFDVAAASAETREFIRAQGLDTGPLLTEPGTYFDAAFHDAPPGVYNFHSVPHRERGVGGRVVVGGYEF